MAVKHERSVHRCTNKEWKQILDRIRSTIPPPEGYRWRIVRADIDDDGIVSLNRKNKTFRIRICKWQTILEMEETVLHELAHALDWKGYEGEDEAVLSILHTEHSGTWGVWYAKLYAAYHGES